MRRESKRRTAKKRSFEIKKIELSANITSNSNQSDSTSSLDEADLHLSNPALPNAEEQNGDQEKLNVSDSNEANADETASINNNKIHLPDGEMLQNMNTVDIRMTQSNPTNCDLVSPAKEQIDSEQNTSVELEETPTSEHSQRSGTPCPGKPNSETNSKDDEGEEEDDEDVKREKIKREQQERLKEERERLMNQQNSLLTAANEVAARFYSSLNMLASRAFLNVKQEPNEISPTGKYSPNLFSSFHNNYFGPNFEHSMTPLERMIPQVTMPHENNDYDSPRMLRPLAELSPDTFAEQLRTSDSASMVVYRPNTNKRNLSSPDSPASVPNNRSSQGSGQGASGLHHFVTRYTIELPEDSSKLGVEVSLDNKSIDDPIIEVECGGNKGLLYVKKLCQGSKGQSILFNDDWITPNEFQFISGRETAKDWKRSIRHCGKSLKSMMTKGILMVHPPVCECNYCKGRGPAISQERTSKKRPPSGLATDFSRSTPSVDSLQNAEPSTPNSSDSVRPLFTPADSKIGREGGLSSIISQLHSKKSQIESTPHDNGESLDLSMTSVESRKGNSRRNEYSNRRTEFNQNSLKRRHSNEDQNGPFPVSGKSGSWHRNKNMEKDKRMRINQQDKTSDSKRNAQSGHEKRSNDDRNNACDLSRNGRSQTNRRQAASKRFPVTSPLHRSSPTFNPNLGYAEYALYDAMKRAVANAPTGYAPEDARQSIRPLLSDSPRQGRRGFINLDSTSPRALSSRLYDSPPRNPIPHHPMMELTSMGLKNGGRDVDSFGSMEFGSHRNRSGPYSPNKSPVTVLHHSPGYYDVNNNHQSTPHTHHYYPMPPPNFTLPQEARKHRLAQERGKRESPYSSSRGERRANKSSSAGAKNNRQNAGSGRQDIDLQNHAIPMMSLTYSKGKRQQKASNKSTPENLSSKTKIMLSNNGKQSNSTSSDDDAIPNSADDVSCRLSSSVPLQSFPQNTGEDIDNTRRTKSESPGSLPAPFSAPKSSASWDGVTRPEPLQQYDDYLQHVMNPKLQFQLETNERWNDISRAIEVMGELSVDGVCEFINEIGCGQYEKKFREHVIDGDALPLLMEHHLVENMGMKLGHALKIISRVHKKLGSQCSVVMDRHSRHQGRCSSQFDFRENLTSFPGSCDSVLTNSGDENAANDSDAKRESENMAEK